MQLHAYYWPPKGLVSWWYPQHAIFWSTKSFSASSSERGAYFVSLQNVLQRESSRGYAALHACCKQLQLNFQDKYPDIPSLNNAFVLQSQDVDRISQCLLPPDCAHLTPLKTTGDGNCLYRWVWHACLGFSTNMSTRYISGQWYILAMQYPRKPQTTVCTISIVLFVV